jgi:hypothetical protein
MKAWTFAVQNRKETTMSIHTEGTDQPANDGTPDTDQQDRANEVLHVLDQWKTRVDELRVQLDLAKLDLRDHATRQIELACNANLAATSKLRDAYHDATTTAEELRDGVEELVRDVKEAFDAVQNVLSRA